MRVLVVEDVPRLADDIAEGLRDQGMAVDVAYDGLDAATKLNLTPYDVLVLDRDLPGLHGDTLCRMITDGEQPVMVLMLTAAGSPGERVAGLALGADDYLPKPFHFPELVLRVRALARRQPTAHRRTLRAAGIELDPLTRTVSRDARQLELSAKEFAVLEALLKASPGVAERREAAPTGVGRKRRSVHQDRAGHHRPAETQARRPTNHPHHPRHRIPDLGHNPSPHRRPKPSLSARTATVERRTPGRRLREQPAKTPNGPHSRDSRATFALRERETQLIWL
jgi:DNA-binding response OmpR family regulator